MRDGEGCIGGKGERLGVVEPCGVVGSVMFGTLDGVPLGSLAVENSWVRVQGRHPAEIPIALEARQLSGGLAQGAPRPQTEICHNLIVA